MSKITEALKLAEALENDAKEHREVSYGLDCPPERTANWQHALNCEAAARLIREELAEQSKCACDSPAWCTKYKKCNREMLGLPKAEPVKQEPVALQDIEQYRMQMAGISTAALGYWKEGDSIHPDYDTPALRDVAALYSKYAKLYAAPVQTVKQEPVAHYKDAPHTIYLQTGCDDPEDCECSFNEWGDTTWCADQIHDTDIPYIRADYAAPVSAKREWVDLTDYEIVRLYAESPMCDSEMIDFARALIAAFKEKNK